MPEREPLRAIRNTSARCDHYPGAMVEVYEWNNGEKSCTGVVLSDTRSPCNSCPARTPDHNLAKIFPSDIKDSNTSQHESFNFPEPAQVVTALTVSCGYRRWRQRYDMPDTAVVSVWSDGVKTCSNYVPESSFLGFKQSDELCNDCPARAWKSFHKERG